MTTTLRDALACHDAPVTAALSHWAETRPDAPALTFLDFAGDLRNTRTLSYAELDRAVTQFGLALTRRTAPGDRVALLLDHSIDFVVAFLACLRVSRVAVPLMPVDARRGGERVHGVLADARPRAVVVDHVRDGLELARSTGMELLTPQDAVRDGDIEADIVPAPAAYLQYSSGSTRTPAGVMVTDRNLAVGSTQLRSALNIRPGETLVSWLPYFHDMGLVFGVGVAVQGGCHGVHLSPMAFVQRPSRWVRALSDFRAVCTVVPNFGLDHATSRIREAELEGVDLSALRKLGNGSEPIRAASLRAFTDRYLQYGFSHDAHAPGYGLAEATLTVTALTGSQAPPILTVRRAALQDGRLEECAEGEEDAVQLVSCGVPIAQSVMTVDPDTTEPLGPGRIGEVWAQGENICPGYFGRTEETEEVFGAQAVGMSGRWLRTGDLGCLVDGHLYVVGRIKDLIIVGGRNHYPADIEQTVQDELGGLRPNAVAAFAHADAGAEEQAVIVIEIEPRHWREGDVNQMRTAVRAAVSGRHELALRDVVLTRPGAIPKTTSGKIQRRACALRYQCGQIPQIGATPL